jgi:type IV pilus assembly protein PilA
MKKLNNKGFSLVELIIVIAIMAILVGVVGTQVIPYLEKSRQAKDLQIISGWNTAAMSAYSMNAGTIPDVEANTTITFTDDDIAFNNCGDKLSDTFKSLIGSDVTGLNSVKWSSKAGKNIGTVTIVINGQLETVTTTVDDGTGVFGVIENK